MLIANPTHPASQALRSVCATLLSALPACRCPTTIIILQFFPDIIYLPIIAELQGREGPRSNPKPSRADKEVTTKLIQAGNIFDVDAASAAVPKEKNIWISKVYSLFFAIFGNFSEHFSRIRKVQKREILRNWRSFGRSLSEYKV